MHWGRYRGVYSGAWTETHGAMEQQCIRLGSNQGQDQWNVQAKAACVDTHGQAFRCACTRETHTHAHARKHTHTHARMPTRTHTHLGRCQHARKHARTHACTHSRMPTRTHACMPTRTHACTHSRTPTRTHTHLGRCQHCAHIKRGGAGDFVRGLLLVKCLQREIQGNPCWSGHAQQHNTRGRPGYNPYMDEIPAGSELLALFSRVLEDTTPSKTTSPLPPRGQGPRAFSPPAPHYCYPQCLTLFDQGLLATACAHLHVEHEPLERHAEVGGQRCQVQLPGGRQGGRGWGGKR